MLGDVLVIGDIISFVQSVGVITGVHLI